MPSEIERLVVLQPLGEGGQAEVLLCEDPLLGRRVALKRLKVPADPVRAERFRQRFQREARTLASLRHPGIPALHDFGEDEGGPYIIMEFIDGESLGSLVRTQGALEPRRAARIVRQLALAIAHVHERGVLHRDLKGDNVVVSSDDAPHLLDFGLCKAPAKEHAGCTAPGAGLGSVSHMPPEQLDNAANADTLSDVFGLGAVLYEVLSGRPPFTGPTAQAVVKQILGTPPAPPSQAQPAVEEPLDAICNRCLQRDPAERYPSALALADDLLAYLEGRPLAPPPARLPVEDPQLPSVLDQLMDFELLEEEEDLAQPTASKLALVGDHYLEDGDYALAVESFEKAHAARPDDPEIAMRLGFALHRNQESLRAVRVYGELLARDPGHHRALLGRGTARIAIKNFMGAHEDFERALELLGGEHPLAQKLQIALAHAAENLGRSVIGPGR